ncbi:AT-hook motif nuclear-localized protein 1-like [Sesbania bispinosa]|nr:AT-hook motif nuclear-localized protein 1-like [Sesbania bispinosa]
MKDHLDASCPQVVVGSFLPSNQQDQKPKKPKSDYVHPVTITPAIAVSSAPPLTNGEKRGYHGWTSTAKFRNP